MSDNAFNTSDSGPSEGELERFDFYVEQLETYLDGELDDREAEVVRQRLAEEPAYAAALRRLHRERDGRLDCFTACGPDDAAVQRLMQSATAMVNAEASTEAPAARTELKPTAAASRRTAFGLPMPLWQIGSALAACVVIGFGLGVYGDFDLGTPPAQSNPTGYQIAEGPEAANLGGHLEITNNVTKEKFVVPMRADEGASIRRVPGPASDD